MGLEKWDAHVNVLPGGLIVSTHPTEDELWHGYFRAAVTNSVGNWFAVLSWCGHVLPGPQFICQTRGGWSSWEVRMPKTAMDSSPLCYGACAFPSARQGQGPGEMALKKWPQCMDRIGVLF